MTILRSHPYRTTSRRVLAWCAWYTRGLDPDAAAMRRDEVASDLHEEGVWAEEAGISPAVASRRMLLRALRGVPADLAWRSGELRQTRGAGFSWAMTGHAGSGLAFVIVALGLACSLVGVLAVVRALLAVETVGILLPRAELIAVATLTILSLLATVLSIHPRSRYLGAALLIVPTAWIMHFTLQLLWYSSATVQALAVRIESLSLLVVLMSVGLALIPIGATLWWWPALNHRDDKTAQQTGERHA